MDHNYNKRHKRHVFSGSFTAAQVSITQCIYDQKEDKYEYCSFASQSLWTGGVKGSRVCLSMMWVSWLHYVRDWRYKKQFCRLNPKEVQVSKWERMWGFHTYDARTHTPEAMKWTTGALCFARSEEGEEGKVCTTECSSPYMLTLNHCDLNRPSTSPAHTAISYYTAIFLIKGLCTADIKHNRRSFIQRLKCTLEHGNDCGMGGGGEY